MDVSLEGRTCLVTGATSGIGRAAAEALARAGATLALVARDPEKGERTRAEIIERTGNRDVEVFLADFAKLDDVRTLARRYLASERPLHVLLNNAGIVNLRREETADGFEATYAVNHLAPFLLTNLLLDRLRASAPARVVNVASDAHRFGGGTLDFDNLDAAHGYASMRVYGQSKLANILFTRELARRLEGSGVSVHAMHPGMVSTGLATNNGWIARALWAVLRPFSRTPERGADTAVWLCTDPGLEAQSGGYWYERRPHAPTAGARSDADARRLWDLSAKQTDAPPLAGAGAAHP